MQYRRYISQWLLVSSLGLGLFVGVFTYASKPGVSNILCELFVRSPQASAVIEALGADDGEGESVALSEDALINDLIMAHLQTYRRDMPERGSANWNKFDASWLFLPDYSELLARLVERYEENSREDKPKSLVEFLDALEGIYKKAGLEMAKSWIDGAKGISGKKRFVRKIVLLLAMREQDRIGTVAWPVLWDISSDTKSFVDSLRGDITFGFGTVEDMQDEYDVFYRREKHIRVPRPKDLKADKPKYLAAAHLRHMALAAGATNPLKGIWKSWTEYFTQTRQKEEKIKHWVKAMRYWQEQYLPLIPLLVVDDEGRTDWSRTQSVLARWVGVGLFVRDVNAEFAERGIPAIYIGVGINAKKDEFREVHWRKELLVQACLLQIRLNESRIPFTGFELSDDASDPINKPYEILSTGSLWTDAEMSLSELNQIIFGRRIEPPAP